MVVLAVPRPDLHALIRGESIVAFAARGEVTEGDETALEPSGDRPAGDLKRAYRRWANLPSPEGSWVAVVEAVHPTGLLDPVAGSARHILTAIPEGDLAILRVYDGEGPVLSDVAFAARRKAVEGALVL